MILVDGKGLGLEIKELARKKLEAKGRTFRKDYDWKRANSAKVVQRTAGLKCFLGDLSSELMMQKGSTWQVCLESELRTMQEGRALMLGRTWIPVENTFKVLCGGRQHVRNPFFRSGLWLFGIR